MTLRPRSAIFAHVVAALAMVLGSQLLLPATTARADASQNPPGPDRITPIQMDYTAYTWWMVTYNDNSLECEIIIDHEGMPTSQDILLDCGESIWFDYQEQPPCYAVNHPRQCEGYYVYLVSTEAAQREVTVKLPPPMVWLTLEGCSPVSRLGTNVCEAPPILVLQGQEPLPDEQILRIEGMVDGTPFTCDPTCKVELQTTDADGASMQFWAWSSYGDSSPAFSAQVRVAQEAGGNPDEPTWYIDVISSQWQGVRNASCSVTWDSFPPVGGPPEWLSSPREASELSSDIPYNYLAGNLILQGAVDASSCPDGGLVPDGGANACGQEAAREAVAIWQNQFDSLIIATSEATGVPAQLLKNLFARESQFWPGVFQTSPDAGLGQLTENGADTTLMWNPSFYGGFCQLVLPYERCVKGYVYLEDAEREALRQALVASVNATCEDCVLGIDLNRAYYSVDVFAETLIASCEQAAQVIHNTVGQAPNSVASYEDLWRMTLVNYNGGPGCLSLTLNEAWALEHALTWDVLSRHFTPVCDSSRIYVDDISK